jgi:hypothetical protein
MGSEVFVLNDAIKQTEAVPSSLQSFDHPHSLCQELLESQKCLEE